MKVINDDTGSGKEGIVIENKDEIYTMVWLRDWIIDLLENNDGKDRVELAEIVQKSFKRSVGEDYTEDNQGMFVISDKSVEEFKEEWADEIE